MISDIMRIRRINKMKKILILLIGLSFVLCGCDKEEQARRIYRKALLFQREHKYAEAIEKYNSIIRKYPNTQVAMSTADAILETQKEQLAYYIAENKPKVIAAVRNYPFPPVFDENTMKSVEFIAQAADIPLNSYPCVDRELKAAAIGGCGMLGNYAKPCVIGEKDNLYIWDAKSTNNEEWTVTMKSVGNKVLDYLFPTSKKHTSVFKVNLTNQTLSFTRREDCGSFAPDIEKKLSKNKRKVNWEKECVVPLKLEGVLK